MVIKVHSNPHLRIPNASLQALSFRSWKLERWFDVTRPESEFIEYKGKMSCFLHDAVIKSDCPRTLFEAGDVIQDKLGQKCLVISRRYPYIENAVKVATWELSFEPINAGRNDEWTYLGSLPTEKTDGKED